MFPAAQRWTDDIEDARLQGKKHPGDYQEIKYEELLENPKRVLKEICHFLEIEFEDNMLSLSKSVEKSGDAKGKTEIVRGNKEKYTKLLSPKRKERIEAIALRTLETSGYDLE